MKKVFIIASAVISIIFAIALIMPLLGGERNPAGITPILDAIVTIITALLIIMISILVIFNVKLPKALRIPLVIISILIALSSIALFGILLFNLINDYAVIHIHMPIIIYTIANLCFVFVVITLLTYIRRALRPEKK